MKILALWMLCVSLVLAQEATPSGTQQSYFNVVAASAQMNFSLTTDRTVYFPSEAAIFSMTAINPTGKPLTVLKPFFAAKFALSLVDSDGSLHPLSPGPDYDGNRRNPSSWPAVETTTVAAGQTIHASVSSASVCLFDTCWLPRDPGLYQVSYSYTDNAQPAVVRFSIIAADLGQSLAVKMPSDSELRGEKLYHYRQAFELTAGGMTYLCVSRTDYRFTGLLTAVAQAAVTPGSTPAPFQRVAQSPNGFPSLTFRVTDDERLVLTWKDASGKVTTLALGSDLLPIAGS